MTEVIAKPQKEIERLRRSVRSRRVFVDNLKKRANALDTSDPTFASRLRMLADEETALANGEETRAKALDDARSSASSHSIYSSAEQRVRAETAMKALEGRFVGDRIRVIAEAMGLASLPVLSEMAGKTLERIEAALGLEYGANRPLFGERVRLAEAKVLGAAAAE